MKLSTVSRSHLLVAFIVLLSASPLLAQGGVSLYQHGGRGMGQVGALTARADDPSAVSYNPAALVHLPGIQLQAGLDFLAPRDDYKSTTGRYSAEHTIQFPPSVYLTWKLPDDRVPVALGFGVDAPVWHLLTWQEALYPGRYLTRRQELALLDFTFSAAYALNDEWSIGGSGHYLRGTQGFGNNQWITETGSTGPVDLEVQRLAEASVDGVAFDVAVHLKKPNWGWGAVVRSASEVDGTGDVTYQIRDVPSDPQLEQALIDRFVTGSNAQAFDLPWEVRTGFWYAPYEELRLELDAVYEAWSVLESTSITYEPNAVAQEPSTTETRVRSWDDTFSLRLAVEGDITDTWILFGGLSYTTSPVPQETLEPGFPRGDTLALGLGFTYTLERLALDVGYSYQVSSDRKATGQELESPDLTSTYSSKAQIFGISARWSW